MELRPGGVTGTAPTICSRSGPVLLSSARIGSDVDNLDSSSDAGTKITT